jgi:organic radical activating enzyme
MVSDKFCLQPWAGLDIDLSGNIRPCCKFREPLAKNWQNQNIYTTSIAEYKNSIGLQTLKESFMRGEKPDACIRCWEDETVGYASKRIMDQENWNQEFLNYDLNNSNTLLLTLPFSNLCNLKCRICGPYSSTSWIKETQDLFNKKYSTSTWSEQEKIWKEILDISSEVVEIHIHGGEPFLYDNDKHIELLSLLSDSPHSHKVKLHYNTNCTIFPDEKYWNFFEKLGWVDIQTSIDDLGSRFEYNRKNAKWNDVEQNLLKYKDTIINKNNMQLSISTTVSVFTIYYLEEFFDYISKNNLPKPWLGKLYNPPYYRCSIFPNQYKNIILKKLQNSKYDDIKTISNWILTDDSDKLNEFRNKTVLHDQYRNESFKNTFSEIYEWLF